ncbi:MAG: hypothetical protein OXU79_05155 [Gemmatimonadota bacterium]|nr:hypothetical protein [Gemmatimonadota bacterium]
MKPPLPNSYWVRPGRFAAGEYPGDLDPCQAAAKLKMLLCAGINHFIDLTGAGELRPYRDIAEREAPAHGVHVGYERFPIDDAGVPRSREWMARILDAIDAALDDGKTVYVHCWGALAGQVPWSAAGWSATARAAHRPWSRSPGGGRAWRRSAASPDRRRPATSRSMS